MSLIDSFCGGNKTFQLINKRLLTNKLATKDIQFHSLPFKQAIVQSISFIMNTGKEGPIVAKGNKLTINKKK